MDSHLKAEMLAYLDGELSEQERTRVEAHLAACPRCAAELNRLRTLQGELGATFDAALTPVRLPAAADRRIRERLRARTEPRPWLGLWQRRGLFAQAALALLVLVCAINTTQVLRLAPPPAAPLEMLVLGQDRLSPGSKAALRVIVRSADEAEPIGGAEVVVRIGRTPGLASIVYTGQTDASGSADVAFVVPEDLEGTASLVIETSSAEGEGQIVHPITVERSYKLFLTSDKPAYRPGQTIHVRALALDAASLKPVPNQRVAFALIDPAGNPRLENRADITSDYGIAALDLPLPPNVAHGLYTLRAALGDTLSERTVTVGAYELPGFRVGLETDRTFYGPGERVTGSVQADYFFGKPIADGEVTLRGYTTEARETPAIIVQGRADEQGILTFEFVLPPSFGSSATEQPALLDLEAEVVDRAGQRAGIRDLLPVAAQPIFIAAIPESGLLKPGIENTVFILTAYPDGQPAETTLTIEVEGKTRTLTSGPYGLAEFRHVPTEPITRLEVRAQDAQGVEASAGFTFEGERVPQALLLRAERAAYEVGDTLRLEALASGLGDLPAQTIYLDVVRARQTIATLSSPIEDGRATFALDLDGTMVGTLELHAYAVLADDSTVQDTRLVIVDAPRQVAVAVTADQGQYRPGETAHLRLQTAITPTAQPVQSALGVGVVDESVYALETLPPSFVRAYFLLERELQKRQVQGLYVPTLLDAEAEVREAQDLAARAAWAGAVGTRFTLSAQSVSELPEPVERVSARIATTVSQLGLLLAALPLLLSVVIVRGLWLTGVLWRALRRVAVGLLVLTATTPLVGLVGGGVMWLLWAVLGAGAPAVVLLAVVVLLVYLAAHGWRRRDARVQLATGLLGSYLALSGLLVYLAARGGDLQAGLLALVVVTFLLTVVALATLGQGLVLEGWGRAGWKTTVMGLLLVPLVIYLPFVPGLASDLTRTLGQPVLYAGPVGWLAGCAAPATPAPEAVEKTAEVVEITAAPSGPTEEPTAAATAAPVKPTTESTEAPAPTPTAEPTASPVPVEAPTSMPFAGELFPLRQVFPETLYWNAEVLTDENGNLTLDVPLADTVTTWRLTALASTQEGELGFTTCDLVVFQDFFVELDLPLLITQGEEITATATLYNYLPQSQTVLLNLASAAWYSLVSPPQAVTLAPNDIATAHFSIRAEQSGDFSLQVTAMGERMSDAVAVDVTVEP